MSVSTLEVSVPEAETVTVSSDTLTAELSDGRTISVPLDWYPRLTHARRSAADAGCPPAPRAQPEGAFAGMKLTYVVVFEQMPSNYSAYAPGVPGCVTPVRRRP